MALATYAPRARESSRIGPDATGLGKGFLFVWALIGLLFFFIFTIKTGSSLIFAVRSIIIEFVLIVYLVRNRSEKSEEK